MDSLSDRSTASFQCEPLTLSRALEVAERLVALGQDQAWENWTVENLLAERPGKWQLSCYASCDGAPIGYAIASRIGVNVHLHHLIVEADWRGRGVGRRLLGCMSWLADLQNIDAVTLKVYRNNSRAVSFYRRLGFDIASASLSPDLVLMHARLDRVIAGVLGLLPVPLGIVVPIRNEAAALPRLLESLCEQLPSGGVRTLAFVDGNSGDASSAIIRHWNATWPVVTLLDNPEQITPVAFNVGIRHCIDAGADAVMLLGGHSWVAPDFLAQLQMRLASTEADIIGAVHRYPEPDSSFQRVVQGFSESRFGRGLGRLSQLSEPTPTDVAFSPTIRRRVFEKIGYFDVAMVRNQDNDFTSRARTAGFSIETDPALRYFYVPRSSLRALVRQMWGNGYWVGMRPAAHGLKYLAPALFWSGLLASGIMALFHPLFLAVAAGFGTVYIVVLLFAGAAQVRGATAICLAATFASAHCAYAGGTAAGLFHRLLARRRKGQ